MSRLSIRLNRTKDRWIYDISLRFLIMGLFIIIPSILYKKVPRISSIQSSWGGYSIHSRSGSRRKPNSFGSRQASLFPGPVICVPPSFRTFTIVTIALMPNLILQSTLQPSPQSEFFPWPSVKHSLWADPDSLWNWNLYLSMFALISSTNSRLLTFLSDFPTGAHTETQLHDLFGLMLVFPLKSGELAPRVPIQSTNNASSASSSTLVEETAPTKGVQS